MRIWGRAVWVCALVISAAVPSAHASQRVDSKTYDGHAFNDCGLTFADHNYTEVCFAIERGDETLDLIVEDDSGFPVVASVYFEDDDNNMIESRGAKEHFMCGRGDYQGGTVKADLQGRTVTFEPPTYHDLFLIPPLATKVLVHLGDDNLTWDLYPHNQCLIYGRPTHWGSTGRIDAIFDGG